MSEENKTLAHRWNQIFEGDLGAADDIIGEECVYHDGPPGILSGPEGVKEWAIMFRDGFTVGIVIDFDVTEVLLAEGSREMMRVTYRTRLGALTGSPSGLSTTLVWENGWGNPPVDNLIAVELEGIEPLVTDGIITLEPEP